VSAQKQFKSIVQGLNEKNLDYLRIEKVGKFYTVRIGKFDDYDHAEKFLKTIKSQFSAALIRTAYIKDNRIIKLYKGSSSDDKHRAKEKSLLSPIPEKIKPQATERSDIKIKTEISTENNKNAEVHYNRGVNYGIFGKHQEAVEAFKQAIKINPDYVEAHYNLGVALGESGMYKEAIAAYKQAIRINPNYSDAYVNLGVSHYKNGMYKEAIDAFKHAIRINSENADTYVNLGVAYGKSGMNKEAVDALKQAIRVNPNNAEAHYNLGFAYLMLNDKNSAINEYEILKNLDTEFANMLFREIHE
jgi:tetratricopeptide (TPR) repeat protein